MKVTPSHPARRIHASHRDEAERIAALIERDVTFWSLRVGEWQITPTGPDLELGRDGGPIIGAADTVAVSLVLARLAGEWLYLTRCGIPIALAGLAAARSAAHFATAEHFTVDDRIAWVLTMADERPPTIARLDLVWASLSRYWTGSGSELSPSDAARIIDLWTGLGTAEAIMETGGDIRLLRDPQTDLNGYGCSHRPRPWAVTFASSTASSVSERGYEAADRVRVRLTATMLRAGNRKALVAEAGAVCRAIGRSFGLPTGGAVVLAASGTDSELLALALSHLAAPDRQITTILLAPEETGSGVPMAAIGRHFAIDTANGHDVAKASPIAGFRPDTEFVTIPLRNDEGDVRQSANVEADVTTAVAAAIGAGRRVILHALDLSKTGLLAPSLPLLRTLRALYGTHLDIVVDACQLRMSPLRLREYLELDAVVQVTGSKFLTGPPFAGAALLPPPVAARLASGKLPAGLDAYFSQGEWPRKATAARGLPVGANYGLLLRWRAALAEYRAFVAVGELRKTSVIERFRTTVERAINRHGIFVLQSVPALQRSGNQWDCQRTIFAFAVRCQAMSDELLDPTAMRSLYRWLNADCSALFVTGVDRHIAGRICHIGQPVVLPNRHGGQTGWLRVSAGARLISGEPSHRGLAIERRLQREMEDLAVIFDKIALLRRHWDRVAAADPVARYR
ncbi:hypothetical protein [Acidiphilium sp.]|uniref:hypothetical protein n=1 Tax=Acidiphilium sp. TaxID=527 RepID=UPI003D02A322